MRLNNLLTYLMKEQVEESIRTIPGKPFNMREFKAMDDLENIHDYVSRRLEKVGEGSSRTAYIVSSKYVLKLANLTDSSYDGNDEYKDEDGNWVKASPGAIDHGCDKGIVQNEAEANTYMEASTSVQKVLPKIYDYHKHGYWLLTELVKPFNTLEEWEQATGMRWEQLVDFTKYMLDNEFVHDEYDRNNFVDQSVLVALCDLVLKHDLEPNDICGIPQWGKTADGRAVLLDAGGTKEVLERYYNIAFYETE